MLYDAGIAKFYTLTDAPAPGQRKLLFSASGWYGEQKVGVTRYYAAMAANIKAEKVIELWRDEDIISGMYCIPEDGRQYRIVQVQHGLNENGLKNTILTLERVNRNFELEEDGGAPGGGS